MAETRPSIFVCYRQCQTVVLLYPLYSILGLRIATEMNCYSAVFDIV